MAGPARFGPYRLHELLGSGGMATVHRATIDLGTGEDREVALKRLLPELADDQQFVTDFVREAKVAVHLRHPNIVRIYELGRIGPQYYIAMELIRGASVFALMRQAIESKNPRRMPSIAAILSLLLELTDALDHAQHGTDDAGHVLSLVHRDLTPTNLLVSDDGHLKIIDFGVAKALTGEHATNSGFVKGKYGYMALEVLRAEPLDGRADLYSAGVVAWEMLTGKRLFAIEDWDVARIVEETVIVPPSKLNPACPAGLDEIVLHAVAKHRDERWAVPMAMHEALRRVARAVGGVSPVAVQTWLRTLRAESLDDADEYAGYNVEIEMTAERPSLERPAAVLAALQDEQQRTPPARHATANARPGGKRLQTKPGVGRTRKPRPQRVEGAEPPRTVPPDSEWPDDTERQNPKASHVIVIDDYDE